MGIGQNENGLHHRVCYSDGLELAHAKAGPTARFYVLSFNRRSISHAALEHPHDPDIALLMLPMFRNTT